MRVRLRKPARRIHRYPEKRAKKTVHVQWMDYERVLETWNISPDYYFMFEIDGEWWACQKSGNFYDNLEINGEYFRKVYQAKFYDGQNGDIIIGYVGIIEIRNNSIYKGRFVFVRNCLMAGVDLSKSLAFKYEIHFKNFVKKEIWKT